MAERVLRFGSDAGLVACGMTLCQWGWAWVWLPVLVTVVLRVAAEEVGD